ncbi:DUF5778 family protein [Halapricum salinum]|uniref:Uncharacterized protein n=1 Tax=Halapricum salinum TaxID=1457250 RepID=A0A4D6HHH6_9EURY|nr:DUF5778 family protein [Halapricum salinum]QCC52167.1 hypothetical protein DV733_13420 [Halapricum salinum]
MAQEIVDEDLYEQAQALLEPGEIELNGIVVHTELTSDDEAKLHKTTVEIGDAIAEYAAPEEDTYIYSGNDDPEFGLNQHQGLTLDDDAFVWECQQLIREGTFRIVFYYEASADQQAIVEAVSETGHTVESVES